MEGIHLFRGIKELLILNIIRRGPIHGSEIHKILKDNYELNVPKPVVYMILRKLEELGLVISEWQTSGSGPVKRVYQLTDDGFDLLKDSLPKLEKLRLLLEGLISDLNNLDS